MQKGSKKIYDFFTAQMGGGSGDWAASGFRPCCSNKWHLPDAISQVLEPAGKNYHEQKCIFLLDLQE
jgi:hypothetical protein